MWLVKKYNCTNYKDLKNEIIKVIYDNPFDIIMYNGIDGKIISENINGNLLSAIDAFIEDELGMF